MADLLVGYCKEPGRIKRKRFEEPLVINRKHIITTLKSPTRDEENQHLFSRKPCVKLRIPM